METVTLDNGQVWAKANLCDVEGLTKAADDASFLTLTLRKTPAYILTQSAGVLYNTYAVSVVLRNRDFGDDLKVPTKEELGKLLPGAVAQQGPEGRVHYEGRYTDEAGMIHAMEIKLGGYFMEKTILTIAADAWWADVTESTQNNCAFLVSTDDLLGAKVMDLPSPKISQKEEDVFGFSVRLIKRTGN